MGRRFCISCAVAAAAGVPLVCLAGGWADLAWERNTVAGWLKLPAEQGNYYNNFGYLITSQWRRADRHEPVVPVFLHCSHTKLAHETRPLGLEKEKEGCNCFRSYTRTYLIDHSANIWFSLWCSKKCLIPINRALLGRILLIASRDCKNETLVSCWGTYYYPPQETLDSLLRKSDLETSRQILRSTWKITSLRVKWVLKASPCSEHEVRVRLSTYLTAFAIQLYQIISKFVFSDGR